MVKNKNLKRKPTTFVKNQQKKLEPIEYEPASDQEVDIGIVEK